MKDIDFDELDRAVGSALGTDDTAPTETPAVSVASTTATDNTPQDDTPPSASTDTATATPLVAKPASPARRRGQFLDMVHPSADMRSTTPLPSAVRKTIAPINVNTTPEPPTEKPEEESDTASYNSYPDPIDVKAVDDSSSSESSHDADSPVTSEDTPETQSSWPDPIEFASSAGQVEDKAENEADIQPSAAAEYVAPEEDSSTEPSQTPFVTDAKVDKRPLGAFTPADEDAEAPVESPHAADAAQLVVSPEAPAPEFSSDINSVEAAGVSQVESEDVPTREAPEPVATPTVEASVPVEPAPVAPEPAPSSTNDGVAQSIPQQYKTADVKKDDDVHSLFDTKEYHQPLLPDGKKKSKKGVLIVVLLVVLLIIGAALGYVAYTVGI